MIVVDTSARIAPLRRTDAGLVRVLEARRAGAHAFVVGEIACGNLAARARVLELLRALPQAPVADDDEVLYLIEQHRLMGRGIGYIDAHLLASVRLLGAGSLWTRDRRLWDIAVELGIAYDADDG